MDDIRIVPSSSSTTERSPTKRLDIQNTSAPHHTPLKTVHVPASERLLPRRFFPPLLCYPVADSHWLPKSCRRKCLAAFPWVRLSICPTLGLALGDLP